MKIFISYILLAIYLLNSSELNNNIYYTWQNDLSLNHKQVEELKEILKDYRMQYNLIQNEYTRLSALNRNLFESDQYDANYYIQVALEIEKKKLEVEKNFFQQIHTLFTPQQRQEFAKTLYEWNIKK